jgi:hypothetical protein
MRRHSKKRQEKPTVKGLNLQTVAGCGAGGSPRVTSVTLAPY